MPEFTSLVIWASTQFASNVRHYKLTIFFLYKCGQETVQCFHTRAKCAIRMIIRVTNILMTVFWLVCTQISTVNSASFKGLWYNSTFPYFLLFSPHISWISWKDSGADKGLKTRIRDKGVCLTETSQCIADPQIILLCYMAECGLSGSEGQAHNLKILNVRLSPCRGPQAVFACPLSSLYSHSAKRRMERNWGSHH